ncbi:MAG: SMC-Scp complex subunit ScpB [Syntrophomonadaceae bacterium]|nr:SMC-Scp complex subunit ScpB [Syntrophomonadaceae bacterium]
MLIREELKAVIEAILFVRAEAVSVEEIARITGAAREDILTLLTELALEYNERKSGIEIVSGDGGFLMCTRPEYHEYVRESGAVQAARLSQGVLETLAIIAYRQPITRAEVEAIRGVRADRALQSLQKRGLIKEVGRKDAPGRPVMYGTTEEFLKLFGLTSLQDLPAVLEEDNDD